MAIGWVEMQCEIEKKVDLLPQLTDSITFDPIRPLCRAGGGFYCPK
jgi:hypothetical protein